MRRSLAATAVAAIYGACFVAIKAGLAFAPPLLFAGLRAEVAGITLLGIAAARRRGILLRPADWPALAALALTSTSIAFAGMFLSLARTGAGVASILANLQPLFVIVLAAVLLGERLTVAKIVALALGLAGVTLISLPVAAGPDAYGLSGAALALAVSLSLAAGNLILKAIGDRSDVVALSGWQLVLGGAPLLALAAIVEGDTAVSWTPAFVTLLLGLALGGTALPYVAWNRLARSEEIGSLTVPLLLVPAFGLVLAWAVFGEGLTSVQLGGLIATTTAVAVLSARRLPRRSSRRPAPPPTSDPRSIDVSLGKP